MNAKRKVQSAKCRNCVAIVMPPSDEVRVSGGDLCEAEALTEPAGENQVPKKVRRRERQLTDNLTTPQSPYGDSSPDKGSQEVQ